MDYRVHGIIQTRILEWVAFPFSRRSFQLRDRTHVSLIAGRFFTIWATWKSKNTGVGSLSFTMGSSQPRNRTGVSCIASRFFTAETPRKPDVLLMYLPLKAIQLLPDFCCDQNKCCSVLGVTEPSVSISLELTLAVEMLSTQPLSKEDVHQGKENQTYVT